MRYLTFDIECCDGQHICEFGYVLTNERFEILEKEVVLIDPDKPFNLGRRPSDIKLFYDERTYYDSQRFPYHYEHIKKLLCEKDQIVLGHAVSNDARFIRTACKRYDLPPIDFTFFDNQRAFAAYTNANDRLSLEKVSASLGVETPTILHRSDEDALLTLLSVEKMCEKNNVDVAGLRELFPTAMGYSFNFEIRYLGTSFADIFEAVSKDPSAVTDKQKRYCVRKFSYKVKPTGNIVPSTLNGKKVWFGATFEKNRVKDALVLIQLLSDRGCRYNSRLSKGDYLVVTHEEKEGKWAKRVREASGCEVIVFDELYSLIGLSEEEIAALPLPTFGNNKS